MEYPALTISFNGKFSSVGILLTFNMMSGDYAKDINIKWYDGTTLLSEKDFVADDVRYFCSNYVRSYNCIILTFKTTSRPYRPDVVLNVSIQRLSGRRAAPDRVPPGNQRHIRKYQRKYTVLYRPNKE